MITFSKKSILALLLLHYVPTFGSISDSEICQSYFLQLSSGILFITKSKLQRFFSDLNGNKCIDQKKLIRELIIRCDEKIKYFDDLKANGNAKKIAVQLGAAGNIASIICLTNSLVNKHVYDDLDSLLIRSWVQSFGVTTIAAITAVSIIDFYDYMFADCYHEKYCLVKEALQQQLV